MRTVSVVGIGAGNPEHITVQAINMLNTVDFVFLTDKGEAAAELLPSAGRRAFLTIGRQGLHVFAPLDQTWFLIRCATPPAGPLPAARHVIVGGPGDAGDERAIMTEHPIDVLAAGGGRGEVAVPFRNKELNPERAAVLAVGRSWPPTLGPRKETSDGSGLQPEASRNARVGRGR